MMATRPVAIAATGLVTSVGLTAVHSCAAFRAKISNPTPTRFIDGGGEWIMAHQVELEQPWRGLTKLAKMAALAIEEAAEALPRGQWSGLPLILCVAEAERPGRMAGLDDELFELVQRELGVAFGKDSAVVAQGRVAVAVALLRARELIAAGHARVLIAATDSLLSWPTLSHYEREDRLLTGRNSNGFMPGEGAGALLIEPARGTPGELACTGLGFGREAAHIASEEPLRADGLTSAIGMALADGSHSMHDMSCRLSSVSGEQYYFKEASLAFDRTLRKRVSVSEHWHPSESMGESGAVVSVACAALVLAACKQGFSPGRHLLLHASNDETQRAAIVLSWS